MFGFVPHLFAVNWVFPMTMILWGALIGSFVVWLRWRKTHRQARVYESILFLLIVASMGVPALLMLYTSSALVGIFIIACVTLLAWVFENPALRLNEQLPMWMETLPAFYFYLLAVLVIFSTTTSCSVYCRI